MLLNRKWIKGIIIGVLLVSTIGCNNSSEQNTVQNGNIAKSDSGKPEIVSEMIEMPNATEDNEYSYNDSFYLENDGKPVVVDRLSNKKKTRAKFTLSKLNDDNTWDTSVPSWSDECNGEDLFGVLKFKYSTNGELYGLIMRNGFKEERLRHLGENGNTYDIKLNGILKEYPDRRIIDMTFIDNSRVLFRLESMSVLKGEYENNSENDKKSEEEKTLVLIYNISEEKIEEEKEYVFEPSMLYDGELNSYNYDSEHNSVLVRKIGEKLPNRTIKCCDSFAVNNLGSVAYKSSDNEFGYVLSESGIVGGKITAESWDYIIDNEDFEISNKIENIDKYNVLNMEFAGSYMLIKGLESEYDFYRLVKYQNDKESELYWIHYNEK